MVTIEIRGAKQHPPEVKAYVERAVDVLPSVFGEPASAESIMQALNDPANVLVATANALAVVIKAGTGSQRFWLLWVDPLQRGKGFGRALVADVVARYTTRHPMRLDCSAELEGFYRQHGFHTLFTADGGRYCYMAGPAESRENLQHLLPRALRLLR